MSSLKNDRFLATNFLFRGFIILQIGFFVWQAIFQPRFLWLKPFHLYPSGLSLKDVSIILPAEVSEDGAFKHLVEPRLPSIVVAKTQVRDHKMNWKEIYPKNWKPNLWYFRRSGVKQMDGKIAVFNEKLKPVLPIN